MIDISAGALYSDPNNNLYVQDAPAADAQSAYRPKLMGGSIAYDITLAYNDCGCVSSFYLVATDDAQCKPGQEGDCPHIDVMQANNYGYNVGANPCDGGNCDPLSQCMFDMREEGAAKYGMESYGPGGSLINTYT